MHSSNMISNYQTPQRNRVQNVSVSKPRKLPSLQLVRTSPHAAFPLQRKLYFSQTQTLHIDTNTTHRHKHYTFTTTTVQQSTPRREYTPPKGSRRRGRDHAVAASAPAHDYQTQQSDHKQHLSKSHKLPSMATVRTNPHATFRCRICIHVCVRLCIIGHQIFTPPQKTPRSEYTPPKGSRRRGRERLGTPPLAGRGLSRT